MNWDQARADVPRERGYYPGIFDTVRTSTPFIPATGNVAGGFQLPIMGIAIVAGIILALEYFRKGR